MRSYLPSQPWRSVEPSPPKLMEPKNYLNRMRGFLAQTIRGHLRTYQYSVGTTHSTFHHINVSSLTFSWDDNGFDWRFARPAVKNQRLGQFRCTKQKKSLHQNDACNAPPKSPITPVSNPSDHETAVSIPLRDILMDYEPSEKNKNSLLLSVHSPENLQDIKHVELHVLD